MAHLLQTDDRTTAGPEDGEVLMLEYLEPLGITQHRVEVAIGVLPRRINEIEVERD